MDDDWTLPAEADGGHTPAAVHRAPDIVGDRFELVDTPSGWGATGVVHEAVDLQMGDRVAVKLIRALAHQPADARFDRPPVDHLFRHPALVRIIARGRWAGGTWLAMEWVDGPPLATLIARAHGHEVAVDGTVADGATSPAREARAGQWPRVAPLALVRVLYDAASCIGAAHRQGLVHLDLKPDNLMVEIATDDLPETPHQAGVWFGDTEDGHRLMLRVIDWGLGRELDLETDCSVAGQLSVHGAPAYLAPERAAGEPAGIQPPADVYALGAMLYLILTGRRPFGSASRGQVLARLAAGEVPDDPTPLTDPDLVEFCRVCLRAMHPSPAQRHADAQAFAVDLRRARAVRELRRARPLRDRAIAAEAEAVGFEAEAAALRRVHPKARTEGLAAIWEIEDRAADRRDEAIRREAMWLRVLRHVLVYEPDLPEGQAALIEWRCSELARAEARGDVRAAKLGLESLRSAVERFRDDVPEPIDPAIGRLVERAAVIVSGAARVTIETEPAGVIEIAPQIPVGRRWVSGAWSDLGDGHLSHHGPVALRLSAPDHSPVIYPAHLSRGEHLVVRRPGDDGPTPVPLPPTAAIGEGEAYIAPGWCVIGGEPHGLDAVWPGFRLWIDGFVMKTRPVTHREWLVFLAALEARRGMSEAGRRVPGKATAGGEGRSMAVPGYIRTDDGWDIEAYGRGGDPGHTAEEMRDWPVNAISRDDALAYADWRAECEGVPWRLPSEWEFEKVARCGDDRRLPWGGEMVPPWTRVAGSIPGHYVPDSVFAPTHDVTVHGVKWTVGNVMTWCLEAWSDDLPPADGVLDLTRAIRGSRGGGLRMVRGASYTSPEYVVSGASRFAMRPADRSPTTGLRLVRSWPPR